MFYGFFVTPYAKRATRMLKKEAKWYLWDWSEVTDDGARFENLVAVHLLKYVHFLRDTKGENCALHYVRNKEKREVDFLLCRDGKPQLLIECKLTDTTPSPHLSYFADLLKAPRALQIVKAAQQPTAASSSLAVISAALLFTVLT